VDEYLGSGVRTKVSDAKSLAWGDWFRLVEAILRLTESELILLLKVAAGSSCVLQNQHVMDDE